jgi:hypothetical protein
MYIYNIVYVFVGFIYIHRILRVFCKSFLINTTGASASASPAIMATPTSLTANNKKRKADSSSDCDCRDHAHIGGGTAATTTSVCNVKVSHLRPTYANLQEWTQDSTKNIYIGRAGVVFVEKQRFPKTASIWANPFKVGAGRYLNRSTAED